MNAVRRICRLPATVWRWRRALFAAVLIAPVAVMGGTDLLAINALGLALAAFAALRLVRLWKGR